MQLNENGRPPQVVVVRQETSAATIVVTILAIFAGLVFALFFFGPMIFG